MCPRAVPPLWRARRTISAVWPGPWRAASPGPGPPQAGPRDMGRPGAAPRGHRHPPPAGWGRGWHWSRGGLIGPHAVLERGASVGPRSLVQRSVLLEDARVGARCTLYGAVLAPGASAEDGSVLNEGTLLGAGATAGGESVPAGGGAGLARAAGPSRGPTGGLSGPRAGPGGALRRGRRHPGRRVLLPPAPPDAGRGPGGGGRSGPGPRRRALGPGPGPLRRGGGPRRRGQRWSSTTGLPLRRGMGGGALCPARLPLPLPGGGTGCPSTSSTGRASLCPGPGSGGLEEALLRGEVRRVSPGRAGRWEPVAGLPAAYAADAARRAWSGGALSPRWRCPSPGTLPPAGSWPRPWRPWAVWCCGGRRTGSPASPRSGAACPCPPGTKQGLPFRPTSSWRW